MRISLSQMPNIPALVSDYYHDFEKVASFYDGDFHEINIICEKATEVQKRSLPLEQIVPILEQQNKQFGCDQLTLNNIRKLSNDRACAIVSGQQVGLFGGPLYTIFKTLTTLKLSEYLNRECGHSFVPVFWMASDDHDFGEINNIHFINRQNELVRLTYEDHPADSRQPAYEIRFSAELEKLFRELEQSTHPSEYKEGVLESLREAYQTGETFSQAFGKWMMRLFKSRGLIIIDPAAGQFKEIGRAIFSKEIKEQSPSTHQSLNASGLLGKAGYHTQVKLKKGLLNLFFHGNGRQSIQIENGHYHIKNQDTHSTESLIALLRENPQLFSPNVMLRPIYQDALLPTAAYVAGNAEISYYAQMKGIYEEYKLPMPVIYPRCSMTLVAPKVRKVLDNYDLSFNDLWKSPDAVIHDIVKKELPESINEKIKSATASIEDELNSIKKDVLTFEPTLEDAIESIRGKVLHQFDVLDKKIVQAYKKRNDIIRKQVLKGSHHVYPEQQLQERVLNIVPFLFKYGFDFTDRLYEAMDIRDFEHQIFYT